MQAVNSNRNYLLFKIQIEIYLNKKNYPPIVYSI